MLKLAYHYFVVFSHDRMLLINVNGSYDLAPPASPDTHSATSDAQVPGTCVNSCGSVKLYHLASCTRKFILFFLLSNGSKFPYSH